MNSSIFIGRLANRRIARFLPWAVLAVGMSMAAPASAAWDGFVSGTIAGIDSVANEPGNYEIRVYVTNVSTYCTGSGPQFAYLNSADNNFKGTLAALTTAYAMGKTVSIFMMNDNNVGCHIHFVQVR